MNLRLLKRAKGTLPQVKAAAQWLRDELGNPGWEYLPGGWDTPSEGTEGWGHQSILDTELTKWPTFERFGAEPVPLALDQANPQLGQHNNFVTFAYVLARVAHLKPAISMLDWGGGIGHYAQVARAVLPEVEVDYHCKDMPLLAEAGPKQLPKAHFYSDDTCFARTYDLVMANDALMLSRDWAEDFGKLAASAAPWLYVALPTVVTVPSFVVLQRAHQFGFLTSFKEWFINRLELLAAAEKAGVVLEREFVQSGIGRVHRAPEQGRFRGFLFRKRS